MKWNLKPIFYPKSVAVVGASEEPTKIGHVILRNFLKSFDGKVHPVNPGHKELEGLKCYPKVSDVPGGIDLVVIAVPARFVPDVMRDCAKKKAKGVIVITGGFQEIGRKDLEDEVRNIANKAGIPIIGVNCLGVFDTNTQVDTLFLPRFKLERPRRGGISFISQSGAVGSAVLDWAGARGFGVSKFISYGNATNVDEVDLLEFLEKDESTKVICAYFEGTKRGKELINVARRVSCIKPIIAIKAGRSAAGAKAVSSHTGSLAGSDIVWDAAFKQAGVMRAEGVDDMFDIARVFAEQPAPRGDRVAVLTNGGGFGVLAADACVKHGLRMAELSEKTLSSLRQHVPEYAVLKNPIDLVGDADVGRYDVTLNALMKDPNVDSIYCIALFQTASLDSEVVDLISEVGERKEKPIVTVSTGGDFTKLHMRLMEENGIPTFDTLESAAKALAAVTHYQAFRSSTVCKSL
ncbi:MAG: CoA-binding protein [Candidatus Diapherotrites archaeon]|nr:CoA-binding protein [Candidatus Diapherotrites archaeon]